MHLKNLVNTIDTHTAGGPTRVVVSGLPDLKGGSVREKMEYFKSYHDPVRAMLMQEPRGHSGMFGAVLTSPCIAEADLGVFFTTSSGYLDMCVHSAIGAAAAACETGMAEAKKSFLMLETPAGLIKVSINGKDGSPYYTITTKPAFVCSTGYEAGFCGEGKIPADVVFSGVCFLMVDADKSGIKVNRESVGEITRTGVGLLSEFNKGGGMLSPFSGKRENAAMALFYTNISRNEGMNAVISASGAIDRSPCGAGTGAKMALLHYNKLLEPNEVYTNKGVTGTVMWGFLSGEKKEKGLTLVTPHISSEAFVTGFHQFAVDCRDNLNPFLI